MRARYAAIIFAALLLVVAGCASVPTAPVQAPQKVDLRDTRIIAFEQSLKRLTERNKPAARAFSVSQRLEAYDVPGLAVGIINGGEIAWVGGYGDLSARKTGRVDADTVFSAGSISKVVNAALVLRLVQGGQLDLDTDVNGYLKSWQIEKTAAAATNVVTLRMLLSHTSGLSQHGFPDFQPGEDLPTALETLNGMRPAKHGPVRLLFTPGTAMKYSGGGITVVQLVIEQVTGLSYEEAAQRYVFVPLGMDRSRFIASLPQTHGNIAKAHSKRGRAKALPRGYESMPELAASGLWTSARDMAKFLQALMPGNAFLREDLRADMLSRQLNSWHGLGPRINTARQTAVFHHGGANDHYRSWMEGHTATGDGLVVLTNGELGRKLAYEVRIAVADAFGWRVKFPQDFAEPSLANPALAGGDV